MSKFIISAKEEGEEEEEENILTINIHKLERNLTCKHNYQIKFCKSHKNVIFLQIVGQSYLKFDEHRLASLQMIFANQKRKF